MTALLIQVRLIQASELGLCVKYHPECEHVTACSSLITLRVGLSTQEDIELWIKAKTKSKQTCYTYCDITKEIMKLERCVAF